MRVKKLIGVALVTALMAAGTAGPASASFSLHQYAYAKGFNVAGSVTIVSSTVGGVITDNSSGSGGSASNTN
jgi:hypothetical protein